jgi:hypothetical protein
VSILHKRVRWRLCFEHHHLLINYMPPRTTRKSYRPRASDRTMVDIFCNRTACRIRNRRRRHDRNMNLGIKRTPRASQHYVGWRAGQKSLLLPVAGEVFPLTLPFIERRAKTQEPLNMTWAGKQSEQPRSFQSPERYLLLTFPFIERANRRCRFASTSRATGPMDEKSRLPRASSSTNPFLYSHSWAGRTSVYVYGCATTKVVKVMSG